MAHRLDPNVGQMSLLSNVKEELKEGNYHYYIGNYPTREEAEKFLPEIKNLGFKTAAVSFNVPYTKMFKSAERVKKSPSLPSLP